MNGSSGTNSALASKTLAPFGVPDREQAPGQARPLPAPGADVGVVGDLVLLQLAALVEHLLPARGRLELGGVEVLLVADEGVEAGVVGQAAELAVRQRHVLDVDRVHLLLDGGHARQVLDVARPAGGVPADEVVLLRVHHVDVLAAHQLGLGDGVVLARDQLVLDVLVVELLEGVDVLGDDLRVVLPADEVQRLGRSRHGTAPESRDGHGRGRREPALQHGPPPRQVAAERRVLASERRCPSLLPSPLSLARSVPGERVRRRGAGRAREGDFPGVFRIVNTIPPSRKTENRAGRTNAGSADVRPARRPLPRATRPAGQPRADRHAGPRARPRRARGQHRDHGRAGPCRGAWRSGRTPRRTSAPASPGSSSRRVRSASAAPSSARPRPWRRRESAAC